MNPRQSKSPWIAITAGVCPLASAASLPGEEMKTRLTRSTSSAPPNSLGALAAIFWRNS